jgi:capsular exopolysaccharide synthesis family protein
MSSANQPPWNKVNAVPGMRPLDTQVSATRLSLHNRPGPLPPAAKGIPYWQLLRGHKFLILGFVALGAIGGTAWVTFQTPLYRAAATVELINFNPGFRGTTQSNTGESTTAAAASMLTQIEILKSRTFLNRVLQKMSLELAPQVEAPPTAFTRFRNKLPFGRKDPLVESREALGGAAGSLSAKQVGMTRLIEIDSTSTSPVVAATFVNTLTAEHEQKSQSDRSNSEQQTSQVMDSQLEEARSRLQQDSQKLSDFVRKSGMDFFPGAATLEDTKMASLRMDASSVQANRITKQSLWELAKSTPPENLGEVMGDAVLVSIKGQIAQLEFQKTQLLQTLLPLHPKVQALQLQIDEAEKNLKKAQASLLKRVQSEYEEALAQEKKFTAAYNTQTHSVSAQADKSSQYAMLSRDVETDQSLYNSLLLQSSTAGLVALAPSSTIRVVDAALPNFAPVSPKAGKDISLAALAGAVLGYGLVLLVELVRRKRLEKLFDSPGYTQSVLGVPELGVIPSTLPPQPARRLLAGGTPWRRSQRVNANEDAGVPDDSVIMTPGLPGAANGNRSSMLSESFRQTLVSLLRTKPRGHNPVYVITSAGPGEGKTTLSANLARAMAETGQRVLLVDADLRRPHLHSLLRLGDHAGLSDVLAGAAEPQDLVLDNYIQSTQIDNLSVMAHGLTDSDTPLFFSPRIEELVALLRVRFDCILLDTAPALPFPDARLWGKHADGVVLVVRAGVTTREGASSACERFLSDGIPVLGTILNDWTPAEPSAMYYYRNGYEKARS